jgi:hypothetical protein
VRYSAGLPDHVVKIGHDRWSQFAILIGKPVDEDLKPDGQAVSGRRIGRSRSPISSQIARACRLSICNWFERLMVFPAGFCLQETISLKF